MNNKNTFIFLGILLLVITSISAFDWNNGTVAYYPLNESSGTFVDEITTNNLNGTNIGATVGATGKLGTAYDFEAGDTTDKIWIPDSENFTFADQFTISLWAKAESSMSGYVIRHEGAGTNTWYIAFLNTGEIQFLVSDGTGTLTSTDHYSTGNFIHVVATRLINGTMYLYLNNTLQSSTPTVGGAINPTTNLTIGNDNGGSTPFDGVIDEVVIFNRSLSSSEVSELYNGGSGLYYQDVGSGAGGITTTLTLPTNNSFSNDDPQLFVSTLTNVTPIKNSTLFLWHDNGTLFTTETNTSNFNNNITFSISGLIIDNYLWNVYGCQENGNGNNCSFANENNTLRWVPFEVQNEDYQTNTYETKNETFSINITTSSTVSNIGVFLIYNGTFYASTHSCSGGLCQIHNNIDIPLLLNDTGSENKSFYWQITLFGTFGTVTINFSQHNQNVTGIDFLKCGIGFPAVNFTIYNETNLLSSQANFSGTFEYYLGSGTVKESANYTSTENKYFEFCINKNLTFKTDSTIDIYNNTLKRIYRFRMESYSNLTTTQPLFIPDESMRDIIIELKDQGLIPIHNYLVKISKYYPALNVYKLIESQLTDENGQFVAILEENLPLYKFQFYDESGILKKTSDKIGVVCRTTICFLPFVIEEENGYFDRYDNLTLFSYSLNFDNISNIFTYSWDDQRGEDSTMRLEVVRYSLNDSSIVCNSTSSITVNAIVCSVGGNHATYKATAYRIVDGNEQRIFLLYVEVGETYQTYGIEGLLWVFILLFTGVSIGLFNPSAGAVIYGAGFIIMGLIGIISMPIPVFFANTLLVSLFIWLVRT